MLWIGLHTTRPFFGGLRWWFRCPGVLGTSECTRMTSRLYLPIGPTRFACRACHRLTNQSAQTHDPRVSYYRKHPEEAATPSSANRDSASCRRSCQWRSIFASAARFDTRFPLPARVGVMPLDSKSSVSHADWTWAAVRSRGAVALGQPDYDFAVSPTISSSGQTHHGR
jgi:hypothetical protein